MTSAPVPASAAARIPQHLPDKLTICLWDFSWYTQAGPGQPYADLAGAMQETKARGYNAVRICAAPMLLFSPQAAADQELAAGKINLANLGRRAVGNVAGDSGNSAAIGSASDLAASYFGEATRWYNTPGSGELNLRERFFNLLRLARAHQMVVIISSWEFQQSAAFGATEQWWRMLEAMPLKQRFGALAIALDRLLDAVAAQGLSETIAFTELHNELDFSMLPQPDDTSQQVAHPQAYGALTWLKERHPQQLFTLSFGRPPHKAMHTAAPTEVGQFHIYAYGVLDALQREIDIRDTASAGFPNQVLQSLQVEGAETFEEFGRPDTWKLQATVITDQMIYGYDTVDGERWDQWLNKHYPQYRESMLQEIESRVLAIARWGEEHQAPIVIGEGWIGYTPLHSEFEEGPHGRELAEHGIQIAAAQGVWGVVTCSNAAPHHPMWTDHSWTEWQTRVTKEFRNHGGIATEL